MYFKKSTRIEPLTPELAKEIAAMPGLAGEREIRASRLTFLRNHLNNGSFVGPNWAIATNPVSGETYRINGQHSSHLLASLEPEVFPAGLNVTIDMYEFSDITADAAGLFNLFDHPKSARTDTDFMGIFRARYPEFAGMDNGFLVKVASGIDANIRSRAADNGSANLRLEELLPHRQHGFYFENEQHRQFAIWLYQWRETTHFNFIGRNGVVSEILNDWKSEPEFAGEFWNYVFRENHPDPEHETRELVRELQALAMKPKKVAAEEWQKKTRKYWSRYYRFRRTQEAEKQVEAPSESVDMAPVIPPAINTGFEAQL